MDAPHMPPEDFRRLGHQMIDWIADYWQRLPTLPVLSQVAPGEVSSHLPLHAPDLPARARPGGEPAEWASIFRDLHTIIEPGLTHWQSPNFFAFFPANISGPAVLAELLSAGLGVQGMLWATSPACTELEVRMLDWFAELLGLPPSFLSTSPRGGGVMQGTASEAALAALIAARFRARALHPDSPDLVVYTSTQAHSSILKAAMIAGIATSAADRTHVRLIDVDHTFAMRPDALAAALREDLAAGRTPCLVAATLGTTSSLAMDPIASLASVLNAASPCWLHIDAAHAGAAFVCPEFRPLLQGIEHADSFCFNPHKWLLTNFDANCFWTRDRHALTQAMSVTPEYLRNAATESGGVIDFRDWHVPLGRRFRSLKLWFVLRHYGAEGLRAFIREHIRLAALFESWLVADPRFELAAPRSLNLICFRLATRPTESRAAADERSRQLLQRLNASGMAYLTHTTLPDSSSDAPSRYTLRMAIGAVQTHEAHVRHAWNLLQTLAD